MKCLTNRFFCAMVLLLWSAVVATCAADAPAGGVPERPFGFRGDGSGRFPDAKPPTEWAPGKNVRWVADVGASYSSPILTNDCVIVASEPDLLVCVRRADGKERWRVPTSPADVPDAAQRTAAQAYQLPKDGSGMTAATPVTDGRSVYAVFANGIVRAISVEDGKPRWTIAIDASPSTGYGRAASPLLVGGKLIVHMTNLYAFDAATGKPLWVNTDAKSTYATPAVVKVGDDEMIVTPGGDVVRVADGKGVASAIGMTQHASPLVDADGVIYFPSEPFSAIRLDAKFKDEEVWNAHGSGETFGTPVIADGVLFIVAGNGKLSAYDTKGKDSIAPLIDGREIFPPSEGGPVVYGSLSLAGKYLYITSNRGETAVLEATREAKEVARNKLPHGSGATPVFKSNQIFQRDGDQLYCIGE